MASGTGGWNAGAYGDDGWDDGDYDFLDPPK